MINQNPVKPFTMMGKHALLLVVVSFFALSLLTAAETCERFKLGAFVNTMQEKLKGKSDFTSLMTFLRSQKSFVVDFAKCVQRD